MLADGDRPAEAVAEDLAATGRSDAHTTHLLGLHGSSDQVLQHDVVALGLPPEVPALPDGAEPQGGQRVEGRGIAGGFYASVRGDFVAPAGSGGLLDRWWRLSATRPRWYRALNVLGALLSVVGL